jgi:hypothetical protein
MTKKIVLLYYSINLCMEFFFKTRFGMKKTLWIKMHFTHQIKALSNIFTGHQFKGVLKGNFYTSWLWPCIAQIQFIWLNKRKKLNPAIERRRRKFWIHTTKLKTKFINLLCIQHFKVALEGEKKNPQKTTAWASGVHGMPHYLMT